MEEKKKIEPDFLTIAVGVGVIFLAYRLGVKRGYRDAIGIIDDICDSAAKAIGIKI